MEEEKREIMQFDCTLGGKVKLPNDVNVLKFAAARSAEIAMMTECITNPCSSKLIFQTLPVHMRRRIMSHNSKRLPRRLRLAHDAQLLKSGLPLKTKRPSRKHRRRPSNLLTEYNRRQRDKLWLETHIWHAKRFHMVTRWGYRLPESPCDKAFRACYRASSQHCLLQDISYHACVQISGLIEELSIGFKKITSPKCGLGICAKAYTSGEREGSACVFNVDKYPQECLGKVMFMWKPEQSNIAQRYLWIFVHPSFYLQFLNVLVQCFDLTEITYNENNLQNTAKFPKHRKLNSEEINVVQYSCIERNQNRSFQNASSIKLQELKDKLNRFRLTGPLSHAILSNALSSIPDEDVQLPSSLKEKLADFNWFNEFRKNKTSKQTHAVQSQLWSKVQDLKSPSELPARLIIGLNVKDPRTNLPKKRFKATPDDAKERSIKDVINMPPDISCSALWDPNVRKSVLLQKPTNFQLNKLTEDTRIVPGTLCNFFKYVPGIPVILIQRPGNQISQEIKLGYNSGWDVVIPSGYAMPLWLTFILRGARAGGLRETEKLAFETGNHDMQPDTKASQDEQSRIHNILTEKYFRLPPNKRVNFTKLSINSPFLCRWQTLMNDWKTHQFPGQNHFVLRDKNVLLQLQSMIKSKQIVSSFDWNMDCLVPVKVQIIKKGKLSDFSLICLPNENDNVINKSSMLIEPKKKDKNEVERRKLRLEHKTLLKRLRKKAIRYRKKILKESDKYVEVPKQDNTVMREQYLAKMRELWLPSEVENVRNQCSREVMGYVTKGDFSFTCSQPAGVGYVTLASLQSVISRNKDKKHCLILTRTTLSRQYRFANLEIITN